VFGSSGDFAKAFKEAYTYQAPYQAAESAAAVHVYADAFKRAQSLDPEKVRDAIAATQLDTFYGPVKFDEAGRNIAKPMVLTQVLHGKYVVVVPAKWATDKPVIPRPPHLEQSLAGWSRRGEGATCSTPTSAVSSSAAIRESRPRRPSPRRAATPS
jgi:branched-chain amino acid transport system substrate-binding protein